jgi:hypothetical protein
VRATLDELPARGAANMTRATASRPGRRADATWLKEHVRLSCTYGMLLCLSRQQRVVYLLGDLLGCTDGTPGSVTLARRRPGSSWRGRGR